ncbi:type IX secretion system membrane protein PorP/SprF [Pedobacter sp. BS3]|uniref:PorP/SprF family type IX secretion system membrane protein n=1 Tax=Pedobacter sp. BS3 TaxID=2567937 RepID=UPI0011F069DA|nr:PorP/SprF family type IX secretion system membrane protein [Pedobacter sp. BS3]TZF82050.1 type IX secretion system membrane protein PorP/SprF [Pedobacter sp. BS3]
MKIVRILIAAIVVQCIAVQVKAQVDPHFSQYYAYPMWLNPALTGVIDGDYRIAVNAKQQWGTVNNSYLTGGASFDMAPVKQFAFGVTVLDQTAGDVDYNYLNALLSGAYRIRFGKQGLNMINFGVQAGILNKSFDASKITLGSQYDPVSGINSGLPMDETFESTSALMPDVGAGIMYFDGNPDQRVNAFAGVSASHLTRPVDKFLGNNQHTPIRYAAHGGARVRVSDVLDLTPNALYLRQGNAHEVAAGVYAQLMLNTESDLLFGSNYRFDDAAIAFLGVHIKSLVIGLSYDVNTSSIQRISNNKGGFELSLTFTSRRGLIGPNFFCPRL